jgi:hypothetical protein
MILLLGLVGVVMGNDEIFSAQDAVADASVAAQKLDLRVGAAQRSINVVASGLKIAEDSISRVDKMRESAANLAGQIGEQNATLTAAVQVAKQDLFKQLSDTRAALDKKLKQQLAMIEAKMVAQNDAIDVEVKARFENVTADLDVVIDAAAPAASFIKDTMDCTKDGLILNPAGDKCIAPDPGNFGHFARVQHHGFENDDGRDCGYLNYRTMQFNKKHDDSYVRVFYYDNLRTHGHTAHGRWNVMFCDASGSGCAHCETPGRIQNWRYSSHQHNWWMNDHMSERTFGLCKKSENRDLKKGNYAIRVMIDDCRYDMYTGSNDYGSFMVDEVMAY